MMAAGPEAAPTSDCWNLDIRTVCCRYPPLCNHVRESLLISATLFQLSDNVSSDYQAHDHASDWGLTSEILKLRSRRNMNIQAADRPHFRLPFSALRTIETASSALRTAVTPFALVRHCQVLAHCSSPSHFGPALPS